MKKIITAGALVTGALALAAPALANTSSLYEQNFDSDADGWLDSDDEWYGTVTHTGETAIMEGDDTTGPFSRFDGYRSEWPGNYAAEIDVHLDPAWGTGEGFDYSVASNGSDGSHQRDFVFHVTKSVDGLFVDGTNNSGWETGTLYPADGYEVTTAGWYTLQHLFRDDSGVLAVDLSLLDADGNLLWTTTRTDDADTIPGEVGGNRYAWFTQIDVDGGVEVDNHELFHVLPTPGDKDDCKNGGFEAFGFENQGQCVASLMANDHSGS